MPWPGQQNARGGITIFPTLEAIDLQCERDDRMLFRGLHLRLGSGQALQVQGANGSGKSTLLRILCGLNDQYQGEIRWQGEPVQARRSEFQRALFYLGHSPAIKKVLSPLENLRWYCATQGHGCDQDIREALAAQGLKGYDDMPCYLMSAGQQRRVSLARLRLSKAPLWILDEPFTALDRRGVEALEGFVSDHVKAGGSVILTTHHVLQLDCELQILNLDSLAGRREAAHG